MRVTLPRLLAATPDAITSALFLTAWTVPSTLGPQYVKNLMLTVLIEFIVMHSSAFYAGISAATDLGRGKRVLMLSGLSVFYMTFIVGFSFAFDSSWPVFAFLWLFASRFLHIWMHPVQSSDETLRMTGLWATSVAAYIFGALATALLPVPALGVTRAFVASMELSGGGVWIDRPQTVLAFGALYFAVQAFAKYVATDPDAARRAAFIKAAAQRKNPS